MGRVLRRLILAEKFSAARRLAQILSEGMAEKVRADASSYFTFSSGGDEIIVFPLRGHIVEIDYPESVRGSSGLRESRRAGLGVGRGCGGAAANRPRVGRRPHAILDRRMWLRAAGALRGSRADAHVALGRGSGTGPGRLRAAALLERRA